MSTKTEGPYTVRHLHVVQGGKPYPGWRIKAARQVMFWALRLAERIDRRSDVTYGVTVSHHHPQTWQHVMGGQVVPSTKPKGR